MLAELEFESNSLRNDEEKQKAKKIEINGFSKYENRSAQAKRQYLAPNPID